MDLHDLRQDYSKANLNKQDLHEDPFRQLTDWLAQAIDVKEAEPTAMTLCTVDREQQPDARIVLLKNIDHGLCFYTNYESKKAQDIAANPQASVVLFWKSLERQVRVQGTIEKMDAASSDQYFVSRPRGSQIGAWASKQSQPIANHDLLKQQVDEMQTKFDATEKLPRPEFWGGYRLVPTRLEFWQGRPSRLHDRLVFSRANTQSNEWTIERLQP